MYRQTLSLCAYFETGRFPLSVNAILRTVKYWLRILRMSESRFPRKANEMIKIREGLVPSWYTKLKSILSEHGFEHVCTSETVAKETRLLMSLRERLINSFDRR